MVTGISGNVLLIQTSCSARIKKSNAISSLQAQLIPQLLLSTVKYSFMPHNILSLGCVTHVTMMSRVLRVYQAINSDFSG